MFEKFAKSAPRFDLYPEFRPYFSPEAMMEIGVFEGTYFKPDNHYLSLSLSQSEAYLLGRTNAFADNVGSSRVEWHEKGWIHEADPLGWFQWFCRFCDGRRLGREDERQISRWSSFGNRHSAQLIQNSGGDIKKRVRQRQGLLHWSHNPVPDIEDFSW